MRSKHLVASFGVLLPPHIERAQMATASAAAAAVTSGPYPWTTRAPTHKSTQWSRGHEQSPSQRVPATTRDEIVCVLDVDVVAQIAQPSTPTQRISDLEIDLPQAPPTLY